MDLANPPDLKTLSDLEKSDPIYKKWLEMREATYKFWEEEVGYHPGPGGFPKSMYDFELYKKELINQTCGIKDDIL